MVNIINRLRYLLLSIQFHVIKANLSFSFKLPKQDEETLTQRVSVIFAIVFIEKKYFTIKKTDIGLAVSLNHVYYILEVN